MPVDCSPAGRGLRFERRALVTTICAVGDIMLGDHPVRIGHGVRSTIARAGAASLFDGVRSLWSGADLLFGNLEVVHADAGLVAGRLETEEFRGAPPTIATLREEGFRVLGVANNHALHHGAEAFEECVARLRGAGIVPLGLADGRGGRSSTGRPSRAAAW